MVTENKIIKKELLDGEWEWIYNPNNNDLPDVVFTLSIQKSKGNEFSAQYCAVAQKGNRIDCSIYKEFNVSGIIKGDKIEATFYSFFDNKKTKGNVELFMTNDNNLEWQITKEPNSEFYAPTKCLLKKKKIALQNKSNQSNALPFDFEDYKNNSDKNIYKIYSSEDLPEITKIINEQINEFPASILIIDNGDLNFQTYVIQIDGDSITQIVVNIKGNKVLSSEIVGYESDSYNTFIINRDLTINLYKVNSDDKSKNITKKMKIKNDGVIVKV